MKWNVQEVIFKFKWETINSTNNRPQWKDAIQCQKDNNTEQSHQKPINLEKLVFEILSPGIGEYFYCCQHAAAVMSLKKVKDGRWTELYPLINSLGAINMETQYTGTKWCSFKSVDLSKLYSWVSLSTECRLVSAHWEWWFTAEYLSTQWRYLSCCCCYSKLHH